MTTHFGITANFMWTTAQRTNDSSSMINTRIGLLIHRAPGGLTVHSYRSASMGLSLAALRAG